MFNRCLAIEDTPSRMQARGLILKFPNEYSIMEQHHSDSTTMLSMGFFWTSELITPHIDMLPVCTPCKIFALKAKLRVRRGVRATVFPVAKQTLALVELEKNVLGITECTFIGIITCSRLVFAQATTECTLIGKITCSRLVLA